MLTLPELALHLTKKISKKKNKPQATSHKLQARVGPPHNVQGHKEKK